MKRWQKILMLGVLLALAAYVVKPMVENQIRSWKFAELNERIESAGGPDRYPISVSGEFETAAFYEDETGWHTVTVALADQGEDPQPLVRQAMVLDTGSEAVQAVAGIAGYEESERELDRKSVVSRDRRHRLQPGVFEPETFAKRCLHPPLQPGRGAQCNHLLFRQPGKGCGQRAASRLHQPGGGDRGPFVRRGGAGALLLLHGGPEPAA